MISYVKIGTKATVNIDGRMYKIEGDFALNVAKQAQRAIIEEKGVLSKRKEKELLLSMLAPGYKIPLKTDGRFEIEPLSGKLVMQGYDRPIPEVLAKRIIQYIDEGLPIEGLINFWKLCLLNPDERVLDGQLFGYLQHNGHPITDNGYFVSYKKVKVKTQVDNDVVAFITSAAEKVRKWKKSAKAFSIYEDENSKEGYTLVHKDKLKAFKKTYSKAKNLGSLSHLIENLETFDNSKTTIYTDFHSGQTDIKLGVPVAQDRDKCDPNPNVTCSTGLHVGNMFYVGQNVVGNTQDVILVCLINPMNVVSIPYDYNNTKMRCCEYFPLMILQSEERKAGGIHDLHYESEYTAIEKTKLEEMLKDVKYSASPDIKKVVRERLKTVK